MADRRKISRRRRGAALNPRPLRPERGSGRGPARRCWCLRRSGRWSRLAWVRSAGALGEDLLPDFLQEAWAIVVRRDSARRGVVSHERIRCIVHFGSAYFLAGGLEIVYQEHVLGPLPRPCSKYQIFRPSLCQRGPLLSYAGRLSDDPLRIDPDEGHGLAAPGKPVLHRAGAAEG